MDVKALFKVIFVTDDTLEMAKTVKIEVTVAIFSFTLTPAICATSAIHYVAWPLSYASTYIIEGGNAL